MDYSFISRVVFAVVVATFALNDPSPVDAARHNFRPLSSLLEDEDIKIALMILNEPFDIPIMKRLWKNSVFTATTDGATNRLYQLAMEGQTDFIPDMISGDFNSVTPEALSYFRQKRAEIVNTPDQDYTDFTKSLRLVIEKVKDMKDIDHFVALGAFGGRLDHSFANIDTLYTGLKLTSKPIVLIGDGNVAVLLDKGHHVLHQDTGLETKWCGLVPVGAPALRITTTGLKYNLNDQKMQFGVLISTSNKLSGDSYVTVKTDQPLLWIQGHKEIPDEYNHGGRNSTAILKGQDACDQMTKEEEMLSSSSSKHGTDNQDTWNEYLKSEINKNNEKSHVMKAKEKMLNAKALYYEAMVKKMSKGN